MKVTADEMSKGWQGATARKGVRDGCPDSEVLTRAAWGDSDSQERLALADHIVSCADCAQEFQMARRMHSWTSQDSPDSAPLESREASVSRISGRDAFESEESQRVPLFTWRLPLPIAAALLIALLGSGLWNLLLFNRTQELAADLQSRPQGTSLLSQPQVNVPIFDLDPGDALRGQAEANVVRRPANADWIALILNLSQRPAKTSYSLEILSADGEAVWQGDGLQPSPHFTFTIFVPSDHLPNARYRLVVYDGEGGRKDVLEEFELEIESESG